MVSFRKSLMVVALLALCAGFASAAVGPTCTTGGTTAVIRSEGVAEPLNEITVTCTDTVVPTTNSITGTYNITLYSTTANVTSVPAKADGTGGEVQLVAGASSFPGIISANGMSVSFANVAITGIGNDPLIPTTVTFTFSITGLRVNASNLTQGGPVYAAGVNLTLFANAVNNVTPPGLFGDSPLINLPNVAYAIPTFNFGTTETGNMFAQCSDAGTAMPTADSPVFPTAFNLKFSESYSAAFKTKGDEGESATQGTRLSATFSGLPGNTQLYVPVFAGTTNGLGILLVSGAKADGSGGTVGSTTGAIQGSGNYWVAVTPGTPVVYEVTSESLAIPEAVLVPVSVAYTGVPSLAPATSGQVIGSYAPISNNPLASSGPIPRFNGGTAVTSTGLYGIAACSTSLLFPYITTQSGWGVGLAVSNTGMDPFGNAGQGGTCSFSFYGTNAPSAPVTMGAAGFGDTTAIAPGTTTADGAATAIGSGVVFTGYAVAVCNFQYAHGYAFIVGNVPSGIISNGYLALVLQGTDANRLYRGGQNGQYERTGF